MLRERIYSRHTARARHVIVLAQAQAKAHHHHYIGPEHILLGICGEPGGTGDDDDGDETRHQETAPDSTSTRAYPAAFMGLTSCPWNTIAGTPAGRRRGAQPPSSVLSRTGLLAPR